MTTDSIDNAVLEAWRFNVMLECSSSDGIVAIGSAVLNLNDLLAILDAISDAQATQ